MLSAIRSLLHLLFMAVTVIPWSLAVVLALAALAALDVSVRARAQEAEAATDSTRRRVLVHASGFRQSPYADTRPAGTPSTDGRAMGAGLGSRRQSFTGPYSPDDAAAAPRKLWHASPGSSGH